MNPKTVWLLAFVTFVLGDLLTTAIGINIGLIESHPLYTHIGHPALLPVAFAVKLVILSLFLLAYEVAPEPENIGIPTGLAILGTAVTAWNSYLILSVV
jgi:hypothetical protein